ncbi:hypothetical protein SDC9_206054 [bioreactor metagenome]|uniref:Uncharacterized protein n=1 Tax=bioreactor metagenome TaxID=1076179 RepID=A0A645J5D8_9ZZZZ
MPFPQGDQGAFHLHAGKGFPHGDHAVREQLILTAAVAGMIGIAVLAERQHVVKRPAPQ